MDDKCLQVCKLLVYAWNIYKSPHGKRWLVKHFCEEDEASNLGCYIRRNIVNCSGHPMLGYLNPEDGSNFTISEIFFHPPLSDSVIQILYFPQVPLITDFNKAYKINWWCRNIFYPSMRPSTARPALLMRNSSIACNECRCCLQ